MKDDARRTQEAPAVVAPTVGAPTEGALDNVEPPKPKGPKRFGTFGGVFTPTLLTILGVIMYLRLGWVIGNAGLLGAFLVILLANGITLATGLSLSSIATNTRMGAGGPYAVISKSLGFEVGGSVGLPLYLSQALAVAMYVFGFREGWLWIFPDHPALLVDLIIFATVFGIAAISADLAFKTQYIVMAIIGVSLISIFASPAAWQNGNEIVWWGTFPGAPETGFSGADFWIVFAVFFPATTGIMVGANMSGELKNPRRSIPVGTLSAIALSLVIYLALAVWLAMASTTDELVSTYTILIDKALWGPAVLAGLLGATFSSALASLVGAPRILQALGHDRVIPAGGWLAKRSQGEPRRAMLITGGIVLLGLMMRDLNVIAPLITMFFLITYAVINVVLLAEESLGLMSFRPTLRLPRLIPLLGTVGCIFAMFIVNPTFSLIAVCVVSGLYLWIVWRGVTPRTGSVRSGIFVAFAEWAAGKVIALDMGASRAWKPSLLVPVVNPTTLRGEIRLLIDICRPEGTLKLLGLATTETVGHLAPRITNLAQVLQRHGILTTASTVDSTDYVTGIVAGLQALGSAFFRPNILFLNVPRKVERHPELRTVIREAERLEIGVLLLGMHEDAGLGMKRVVNLWLRPKAPGASLDDYLARSELNLGILTALRLRRAWKADLNLITVIQDPAEEEAVRQHVEELRDLCRIPQSANVIVMTGPFDQCVAQAPQSDMDIMGLRPGDDGAGPDLEFVARMIAATRSSCLFVGSSGYENALA